MTASAHAPTTPPICELCRHGWSDGERVMCLCAPLVQRHGVQPVRWMRDRADACGAAAAHRELQPFVLH
jgi:hypothetical protein